MHVIVIVLGDVGRSPRMQYHCVSLLECGHNVTIIGYDGESLVASLQQHGQDIHQQQKQRQRLHVIRFHAPTLFKNTPIYFIWRLLSLTFYLFYALLISVRTYPIDFVLVQNPPAIPLLAIAYMYCYIIRFRQPGNRRPGFIIDWHNLGYSMFRKGSILQRITKHYETCIAPYADGHFTVTKAMKEYICKEMLMNTTGTNTTSQRTSSPNIDVLYDCPPNMFEPLDVVQQHDILMKLHSEMTKSCPKDWYDPNDESKTLFTETYMDKSNNNQSMIRHRVGRPALITSSTSWTADEDFDVLLKALVLLDTKIHMNVPKDNNESPLRVVVVVTGKGPERKMYEEKILQLQMKYVVIITMWLEINDYPKLLACADMGISLHTSTSGYDLPMKVLDLFGCHTPVLAHDFQCLHELVHDKVNGRIFSTSDELANLMYTLLVPLQMNSSISTPNHSFGELQLYSNQLMDRTRWHSNWMDHALPVIMAASPKR